MMPYPLEPRLIMILVKGKKKKNTKHAKSENPKKVTTWYVQ